VFFAVQRQCGSNTRISGTYFTNPGYPGILRDRIVECSITVFKKNANVYQVRIVNVPYKLILAQNIMFG
jgi:hypothetical protein